MYNHQNVVDVLVEIGEESGKYDAFLGDSRPIDLRFKKTHVEYRPDVYWSNKRTKKRTVFEVPFQEDWRAIVGEMTMALLDYQHHCAVCICPHDEYYEKPKNAVVILQNVLIYGEDENRGNWVVFIFVDERLTNDKKALKRFLKSELKRKYVLQ
jgi:hypothetical protein